MNAYSGRAQRVLRAARSYANDLGNARVLPAHLVVALLSDGASPISEAFRRLGVDPDRVTRRMNDELRRQGGGHTSAGWDPTVESLLREARRMATREGAPFTRTHHLMLAAAEGTWGLARRVLQEAGITRTGLEFVLRELRDVIEEEGLEIEGYSDSILPDYIRNAPSSSTDARQSAPPKRTTRDTPASGVPPIGNDGSAGSHGVSQHSTLIDTVLSRQATSLAQYEVLGEFGRDLTEMARDGNIQPTIGRNAELRRVMQVLGRRSKNNPILVGEPGIGKGAIIQGLARYFAAGDVASSLRNKRLVQLDVSALVAGTSLRGQFEERIKKLIAEVVSAQGDILLFVDDIHTLVTTGARGDNGGAASLLKPALARGEITLIGTTTAAAYRKYIETDKALAGRFQAIEVQEPTVDESIAVLRGIKSRLEIHHKIQIDDAAVVAAVQLSDRYVLERNLPDKAIDIIDEAAAVLRLAFESEPAEIAVIKARLVEAEEERASLGESPPKHAKDVARKREEEAKSLREQLTELEAQLEEEKEVAAKITELKAEREAVTKLVEKAQADNDLERAAELRYGIIAELEKAYEEAIERSKSIHKQGALLREVVNEEDVAQVVASWTGIPVQRMMESERQKLIEMDKRICERVIGQDHAVKAISAAVRRSRAGVQPGNRPIGNFFFVGPTGVGKTELAKALAEFLFGSEDSLIRIDMSEYMEQSSVNSLIGSAYGYVDSDKGGILTEAVRRRPYSVILFDEAEKAHPDVFNLLLQVLDEGRLTDAQGRLVDFSNTLILMTSNVGARDILELTGKVPHETLNERVQDILRDHFKPEFLNRLDDIVVFHALSREDLERIMDILLRGLQRLLAEQHLGIELSESARKHVIDVGYQPEYGARPLKRALLTEIQDPLALAILEETFGPGDTVYVDTNEDGELTFKTTSDA